LERLAQIREAGLRCRGPRNYQQVPACSQLAIALANELAQPATYPVPLNRPAEGPWGAEADPRGRPIGPHRTHDEKGSGSRPSAAGEGIEVRLAPE
jgi:hypothetical protein